MGVESLQMSVRGLLRQVLQELDVANACVEEIRIAVRTQDRPYAAAAAMSLYRSWARTAKAIAALERVSGGGGASEDFARDALRASYRAGARAVAALLTMVRDAAAPLEAAAASPRRGERPGPRNVDSIRLHRRQRRRNSTAWSGDRWQEAHDASVTARLPGRRRG